MSDPLVEILRNVTAELERREALPEVVPLRVEELPKERPYLPCLWLDEEGRPHPAVGLRGSFGAVAYAAASMKGTTRLGLTGHGDRFEDPVLYPESAAPTLWARFLARQAGRVG